MSERRLQFGGVDVANPTARVLRAEPACACPFHKDDMVIIDPDRTPEVGDWILIRWPDKDDEELLHVANAKVYAVLGELQAHGVVLGVVVKRVVSSDVN